MTTKTPPAPVIVNADGCYLAVLDLESPANREGHYQEGRKLSYDFDGPGSGKWDSGSADLDFKKANDRMEQYWAQQQEKGDILSWVSLSGVYKVSLELITDPDFSAFPSGQRTAFSGGRDIEWELHCPSGRLAVVSLKELGGPGISAAWTVEPGTYRAGLEEIEAETRRHYKVDTVSGYPAGEGPDFILRLQRRP